VPGRISPTEAIREMQLNVSVLEECLSVLQKENDKHGQLLHAIHGELKQVEARLRVLEARLDDHNKRLDQMDVRRWQVWLALAVAAISLITQLILTVVRL
jgi:chromosome segregation ATPase